MMVLGDLRKGFNRKKSLHIKIKQRENVQFNFAFFPASSYELEPVSKNASKNLHELHKVHFTIFYFSSRDNYIENCRSKNVFL